MEQKKKVVFVCTHNAGKSRLAEAYLTKVAGDRFEVLSAGTEPSDSANPAAVVAADEASLQLRSGPGVRVTSEHIEDAEAVVTFGCDVGDLADETSVESWDLVAEDGEPLRDYSLIREAIATRVDDLVQRLEEKAK